MGNAVQVKNWILAAVFATLPLGALAGFSEPQQQSIVIEKKDDNSALIWAAAITAGFGFLGTVVTVVVRKRKV